MEEDNVIANMTCVCIVGIEVSHSGVFSVFYYRYIRYCNSTLRILSKTRIILSVSDSQFFV